MTAFLLIFTVLVIFPNLSENCASNGVCGGYDGCPPAPPPSSCSCPGSYGCGRFGCYRMGARDCKRKRKADRTFLAKYPRRQPQFKEVHTGNHLAAITQSAVLEMESPQRLPAQNVSSFVIKNPAVSLHSISPMSHVSIVLRA
ncbi:unnamed protein product, partial [Mesorhabditis belari]|uniref:Uncharacterized protein n=1 Tax=Mesorhabditis belari TaxID=2138241 RepID=A0AAF3FQY6_9BILA